MINVCAWESFQAKKKFMLKAVILLMEGKRKEFCPKREAPSKRYYNSLKTRPKIGDGSFGQVSKVTKANSPDSKLYAHKSIPKPSQGLETIHKEVQYQLFTNIMIFKSLNFFTRVSIPIYWALSTFTKIPPESILSRIYVDGISKIALPIIQR